MPWNAVHEIAIYASLCQICPIFMLESTGMKCCCESCCYAYDVTRLWRHQHLPWQNALSLITIGTVAHDAIWNQISATGVNLNRTSIHISGLIDQSMHRPHTREIWEYILLTEVVKCVPINVFFNFNPGRKTCEWNDPRPLSKVCQQAKFNQDTFSMIKAWWNITHSSSIRA